jgi:hypothetical protein
VQRMASNLNLFLSSGYYKVTRATDSDASQQQLPLVPSRTSASSSQSSRYRHSRSQGSQEEAEELLFESNASFDSVGTSSHPLPLSRFREGSFDIEMSGGLHAAAGSGHSGGGGYRER